MSVDSDEVTHVVGAEPRAAVEAAGSSGGRITTIFQTAELRHEREAQRKIGLLFTMIVAGAAALALQFARIKPAMHWPTTAVLVFTFVATTIMWVRARRGLGSQETTGPFTQVLVTVAALMMIAHVGVASALVCVLPVIIYYVAVGDFSGHYRWLLVGSGGGYAVLVVLALMGVIPLRESLTVQAIARMDVRGIALLACGVELVLAVTYFMARASRQATLRAMEQLEAARRGIQQREALLNEARVDFDNVINAGRIGRLTGQTIGSWRAGDVIGRGGMGEIYRAVQTDTGEVFAIKVLHPHLLENPTQLERFFREARISSELDSPYIVRVHGSGHATDGAPYLVMEFLEGEDLGQLLRDRSRLRMREILELVSDVAQALSAAHDAGIVHRDLKPQNVFRVRDGERGRWKVLDFGVSKIAEAAGTLTQGATIGTPSYMSPEQARGENVDHRSDVFSLGVITYRILTGRPPFTAPDALATLYRVTQTQPARPADFMHEHEDVELVLALALAKDREQRFRTATAFSAALADAARGELDERFRQAAQSLLTSAPWGTELKSPAPNSSRSLTARW